MTQSEMKSLRCFDDTWRNLRSLKSRGVDVLDLPFLIDGGFVIGRDCGGWGYQITELGQNELKTNGPSAAE